MKTILITGADGQLGKDCCCVLGTGGFIKAVDIDQADIASEKEVTELVSAVKPDVIVNCAAFTQVDACEENVERAWDANARGPANLAKAAAGIGARLIHISTDYVFDGTKKPPEAYTEYDSPRPVSVYGKSKLAGETRIMEITDNCVILRTAWLYGAGGKNFLRTIAAKIAKEPGKRLKIVADQHGAPTWSYRLALQIQRLLPPDAKGIYHASAEGSCTWYELACLLCRQLELACSIESCTTAEYPTPARRPQNSILENHRLKAENLNVMVPWQQDVEAFLAAHGRELTAPPEKRKEGGSL
ncbi:MAG: dTDP-4-dehydrorhamnose reductase [Desulfosalsimonadaceae bacterium]